MNIIKTQISLLALLVAIVLPDVAEACSCAVPGPIEDDFNRAVAVFVADVLDMEKDEAAHFQRVRFVVTEFWKGDVRNGDLVHLEMPLDSTCSKFIGNEPVWLEEINDAGETIPARVSTRWLIWAYGDKPWSLSLCTRSNPIELAAEDYEWLKALHVQADRH